MSQPALIETILFLDIDGPLRPHGCLPKDGPWVGDRDGVCPARISLLNSLAAIDGLRVVVSSAWRSDVGTLGALFRQGLAIPFHERWRTTQDLPRPGTPTRGWQVDRWIKDRPGRVRYAILDDENDFAPRHASRLVLVDPFKGIDEAHVGRLFAMLSGNDEQGARRRS